MPFYEKVLFIGGPWNGEYKKCLESYKIWAPYSEDPEKMAEYIRTTITVGHTGVIVYVLIGIQEADVLNFIISSLIDQDTF